MGAMEYEILIRGIHRCGRFGVAGANADIYRGLERNYGRYQGKLNNEPQYANNTLDDLAYQYGVTSGEVANHILIAIEKLQNDYEHRLSEDQNTELENLTDELNEPSMNVIDNVIERIQPIMHDLGLYPIA